ncbi:MAG: hypothetical protein RL132_737 [Pseudomonadota bacterium]|jgi:diacylglycerol kinase (ATP)
MLHQFIGIVRRRMVSALIYSIEGFGAAWKSEEAIKVEIILLPALAITGLMLGETGVERAMLISSLLLIIITELLNTAVEKTIDRISIEKNPLSKKVKDMGSAAVLGAIVHAVVVWSLILL